MRRGLCLLALLAVAGGSASAGRADNWPDGRLDAVASSVAGAPVSVWCEASGLAWDAAFQTDGLYGKTFPGQSNVVYLSPLVCDTLHAILMVGPKAVGPYWGSLAIQVLLHESVHQRGVLDEGVTDCTALSLLKQYAVSSFGYPATITVKRRVGTGRHRRLLRKRVPNPDLEALYRWDLAWHRALPPQYQGSC